MKLYEVPVTWTTGATAMVRAASPEEAAKLAADQDMRTFEDEAYVGDSFQVDWDNIHEVGKD